MKKFEFRLERVERWREIQKRLQEEKVRKAVEAVEAVRRELAQLADESLGAARDIHEGGSPTAWAAYPSFQKKIEQKRGALLASQKRLEVAAALEQRRLLEAHRSLRLLEKLHETQLAEWTVEMDKENERFAGEAFLCRVQSNKRARSSVG